MKMDMDTLTNSFMYFHPGCCIISLFCFVIYWEYLNNVANNDLLPCFASASSEIPSSLSLDETWVNVT